jgi:hypothetical protein
LPEHNQKRRRQMSNSELAEHIGFALECFADSILKLRRQQEDLAARIAWLYPTEGDISREVEHFIRNSLAA